MIPDYFSEPLQGYIFKRFRYIIMGYVHINYILIYSPFPPKECAEKCDIFTENDEENNGNKFYTYIVKENGQK